MTGQAMRSPDELLALAEALDGYGTTPQRNFDETCHDAASALRDAARAHPDHIAAKVDALPLVDNGGNYDDGFYQGRDDAARIVRSFSAEGSSHE